MNPAVKASVATVATLLAMFVFCGGAYYLTKHPEVLTPLLAIMPMIETISVFGFAIWVLCLISYYLWNVWYNIFRSKR